MSTRTPKYQRECRMQLTLAHGSDPSPVMESLSADGERLEELGGALVLRELVTVEQAPNGLGLLREERRVSRDADVGERGDLGSSDLPVGGGLGDPESAVGSVFGHAEGTN
jgi:hypothetical protein